MSFWQEVLEKLRYEDYKEFYFWYMIVAIIAFVIDRIVAHFRNDRSGYNVDNKLSGYIVILIAGMIILSLAIIGLTPPAG